MEILKTKDMELHEMTKTHPVMDDIQYEAFKADIGNNGQIQPVLLYRGRIVDGRHRLRALTELGIDIIKAERLPNNLTMDKLRVVVNSTEVRRHQTPTMLAVKAYRMYVAGTKQAEAAKIVGASLTQLQRVAQLANMGRLDIVDVLEQGGKFNVSGDPRIPMMSDSLPAIIKRLHEDKAEADAMVRRLSGVGDDEEDRESIAREHLVLVNSLSAAASVLDVRAKKMLIAKLYEGMENG